MNLKTNVDVTFNEGISEQATGKVTGFLVSVSWITDPNTGNFDTIGANFVYLKDDGTNIAQDAFTISGAEIQALYDAVKAEIPTTGEFKDIQMEIFYLGFRNQMATTFSITTDEIDIERTI